MLIQIFDIFQISHFPKDRLPKLLYDFKEPFDKDLAMNDWKYGEVAILEDIYINTSGVKESFSIV